MMTAWWKLWMAVIGMALCAPAALAQMPDTWTEWSSWSFEETNFISDFGYAPSGFTNALSVPSFDGLGVLIASNGPAYLAYNMVEADGTTNLSLPNGSWICWFAPTNWSGTNTGVVGAAGPGSWGRLLEVGQSSGAHPEYFSLYTDPGGGNLYLSAQTNGGSPVLFLTAPICWTNGIWHQIGVTYCPTGTVLYLDGVYATNGAGVSVWPGLEVQTNGFFLGSDGGGSELQQAYGVFDNVETFSAPIDPGTVAEYYGFDSFTLFNPPPPVPYVPPAPFVPQTLPTLDAITGLGLLQSNGPVSSGCVTSSNVWLTNIVATIINSNQMNFTFSIAGGVSGAFYDVFAASTLSPGATNSGWSWMGQASPCNSYTLPSTSMAMLFCVLGSTAVDSDADGIPDAFEELLGSNPNNPSTSGDGISDLFKLTLGLPLGTALSAPSLGSITVQTCAVP